MADDFHPLDASSRRMRSAWLARQRGNVSLVLAALAWTAVYIAGREQMWPDPWLTLARHISEGALAGGIADWFAVRALFRHIPIPLLQRHTNIISKNRPRLTEGIVDMVQNQWLAPAVIRARLQQISLSAMAVRQLQQAAIRERTLRQLRSLASHIAGLLDNPVLVRFVADLASRHLQSLDLRRVLLRPLRENLDDDAVFDELWRGLCQFGQQALRQRETRAMLHLALEQLITHYLHDEGNKGVLSGTWARIKLWVGLPVASERQQWLEDKLDLFDRYLQQHVDTPSAELRQRLRTQLQNALLHLEDSENGLPELLLRQQTHLIERLRDSNIFQHTLSVARQTTQEQLASEDSELSLWLADVFDDAIATVQNDPELQLRLDQALANLLVELVEHNPDAIGATVRLALSPERLSNADLVHQIEDKVGDDLQWIRVNGALVGALVAGVLTALHLWGP